MVRQLCVLALYTAALPMLAFAAPVEKNTPAQTGAFLAYCKSNDDGCISEVSDVSFAMSVQDRSWCPTPETDDIKMLTPKVLQWLTAHPETHDTPTDDGITAALKQLYPCKH